MAKILKHQSSHHHGVDRWKRHRRWGASPWMNSPWSNPPWATAPDGDDDNQDDDDGSQEFETPGKSQSFCLEDRCTSDYVTWMQKALIQLGSKLKPTGRLDRDTINAIN